MTSDFSQDWFEKVKPEFAKTLLPLAGRRLRYVEIGVYEGRSAVWVCDNVLTAPGCEAVLVDAWGKGPWSRRWPKPAKVRAKAVGNLDACAGRVAISFHHERTPEFFATEAWFLAAAPGFDVAYIDGCHSGASVRADAEGIWPHLNVDGLMLFDDYGHKENEHVRRGVHEFLATVTGRYAVVSDGLQLHIRRTG